MFDASRPPSKPIPAATVLLLRERAGRGGGDQRELPGCEVEVFFVKRHRQSTFMSNAFVFPGGKVDPDDRSVEIAAIRELFEEAGVLLVREPVAEERRRELRRRANGGEPFSGILAAEGLTPATERLHEWARWITPSVEPKRFDARFFLAEAPPDQAPAFDDKETVEQAWLTPAEAAERHAGEALRLPPPQLRTMLELAGPAVSGVAACVAAARARHATPHPIMPRFAQVGGGVALLLPWDPEYETAGVGEGVPMPAGHPLAVGPSRFLLEGMTWRMTVAPSG